MGWQEVSRKCLEVLGVWCGGQQWGCVAHCAVTTLDLFIFQQLAIENGNFVGVWVIRPVFW